MRKYVSVDFGRCDPSGCGSGAGICPATVACPHHMLVQEQHGEPPMLVSATLCVGCSLCVAACPRGAIRLASP